MSHTPDEQALIKACARGQHAAQKVLYERYADLMRLLCYRYIPVREDAQEVMLDGFCKFFKNLDKFNYKGEGSVNAWLKKIMVNECLMHLRKKAAPATQDLELADSAGINEEALARLSAKEILALVHALPDGYRTVFNLYFFEEMTTREIGEALGISENTAKSQLRKARASLKTKLEQQL